MAKSYNVARRLCAKDDESGAIYMDALAQTLYTSKCFPTVCCKAFFCCSSVISGTKSFSRCFRVSEKAARAKLCTTGV
jgi:hypothetical protein